MKSLARSKTPNAQYPISNARRAARCLLLLLLPLFSTGPLCAQVGNGNPAGASGIFNGLAGGCGYDPYTANATRSITDISVAGAVGEYPLALIRTANSRAPSTTEVLGWAGGWNHNYNWILEDSPTSTTQNFQPNRYTVDFPDGRVETFHAVTWDNRYRVRPGADTPAQSTSAGVPERFVPLNTSTMLAYLILPDGGQVEFTASQHVANGHYYYKYHATGIIDPYGLRTQLVDEVVANGARRRFVWVIEPAGRWLHFVYTGPNSPRIDHVDASDGRTVQYYYIYCNGCRLDRVRYYNNAAWDARYQYCNANLPGDLPPLLWTCDDPMYAGPMKRIAYDYKPATPNNPDNTTPVYGQILRERYWDGTQGDEGNGAIVSTLTVGSPNNNSVYRTETRADGATRTFIYNGAGAGYLAWVSDFMGLSVHQHYDANTKYIDYVVDRNGHQTDYTNDPITGNVTQVKYPLTQGDTPGQGQRPTVNYGYSNYYYLHTITDEGGNQTIIQRNDSLNRVTGILYPDGGQETFPSYNSFNQVLTHGMLTGGTETFTYDGRGLKQTYRSPDNPSGNPTARYRYDVLDRLTDITDVFGTAVGDGNHSISFSYNDRGQVLVTTLPKDVNNGNSRHTTTNAYNDDGTLQNKTDQLNQMTSYTYDDYRRLTSVTSPTRGFGDNSAHTTYCYYYDPFGSPPSRVNYADTNAQPSFVFVPSGKAIWNMYDNNWRKWWTTIGWNSGEDATTIYAYDGVGNMTWLTNPRSINTHIIYDERNRPSEIDDVYGNATSFQYDTAGRRKKITRPNNETITYDTFDAMNRVTQLTASQTPSPNAVTKYVYYAPGEGQPVGFLKTMQDPHLAGTNYNKWEYDTMGRKKKLTYPPETKPNNGTQRTEQWTYDAAGRLQTFVNRNGDTQTLTYDALNRLSYSTWNDGLTPRVDFGYDAASRLTSVTNANATISRGYFNDNLLRTETETATGGTARTLNYTYDADGNRATLQIPGYSFSYDYTGRNQLLDIKQNGTALASYVYDENGYMGDLTTSTLANNTSTTYQYDSLDRVTHIAHSLAGGNARTFDYGYDSVGNRKWIKRDGGNGDVFRYDLADEVTAVKLNIAHPDTTPTPTPNIAYDANGNRTTFSPYGTTDTYTTKYLNEYTQRNGINADYYKNATLKQGFDGSIYQYDAPNRLLTAQGMSFAYDGLNRQVSRTGNSGTTFSVWDGWNLVQDYHMSVNNVVEDASYLYGATGLVTELLNNRYYYQDGGGSTSHLASSSGTQLEWYRYDLQGTPFVNGDPNNHTSAYGVRHLFTGQQWYKDIGLYDLRNRFYSPDIGRFLQPDPIGFNGDAANLYRYCGNNPATYGDPTGEYAVYKASGGYWYYIANPGYQSLVGSSIGSHGWCAEGAQMLAGGYYSVGGAYHDMPNTSYWRQGGSVTSTTAPGIVVARGWVNSRYAGAWMSPKEYAQLYPNLPMYHTGIFVASFNGEAFILEQYVDKNGVRQSLQINAYSLKQLQQQGWSEVTVPGSDDRYASGTSTDPNARGGSDAPGLTEDQQAQITGLLRLASMFNPYWGYLPTTFTSNFAGGKAGLPGGGSPWDLSNQMGGLDPMSAFGHIYEYNPIGAMEGGRVPVKFK
jgi:RHS repeat-associated protein